MNIVYQLKKQVELNDHTSELLLILEEELYQLKLISDELAMFSKKSSGETCLTNLRLLMSQFKTHFSKDCVIVEEDLIHIKLEDPDLSVDIDPQFLFSILKTIIFNALIKTEQKQEIDIFLGKKDDTLTITLTFPVRHDPGIKNNGLEQIISSTEDKILVNLSMAIVEYCIKQRQGKIWMEDCKNEKTQIIITLPATAAASL